ncbi:hypothetical protein B0G81_3867 [Paraburkholderia sp. BL6665CI2N2]|nr:hypothetical protein B0G81_3867 [Paraburkholderia sp. BL6665CI2N2]
MSGCSLESVVVAVNHFLPATSSRQRPCASPERLRRPSAPRHSSSQLHHQRRIKRRIFPFQVGRCTRHQTVRRIAARVGDHTCPANAIIERVMHVTVNLHVGQPEQRPEVTQERSVDRVVSVAWMHRRRRNAVMGYHDGAALERFCPFVTQPAERFFVLRQRVPWPEPLIVTDPDHTMVVQHPPGQRHAPVAHALSA